MGPRDGAHTNDGSLLQLDEPGEDPPRSSSSPPPPAFAAVLAEIENARAAVAVAFKKVLVGPLAIVQPELGQLGAGPPEIDAVLERVGAVERKLREPAGGGTALALPEMPPVDRPVWRPDGVRLASYVSRGLRYLIPAPRPLPVGFGIAVSCDDYRAIAIGDDGRISCPVGMSVGVAPFVALPPEGMRAAALEDERRYRDHAGHGLHLPTYVEAYAELFAFALQDAPTALGALLLCERLPRAAADLLRLHAAMIARIRSAALYFLGYEERGGDSGPRLRRSLRDSEVSRACGMRLVEELVEWQVPCSRHPVLGGFAAGLRGLQVDKIASLAALRGA